MAKQLNYELLPGLVAHGAYAMIGETRVSHFHQSCEIDLYVFASEDARNQLESVPAELRRPLKVITVRPPISHYQQYIEEAANVLRAAGYRLLHEVPESAAASPHGLRGLMATGEDV